MVKVRFLDFWSGFNPSESLFTHLIKEVSGTNVEIVDDPNILVDVQFESVFDSTGLLRKALERVKLRQSPIESKEYFEKYVYKYGRNRKESALKRIWYTGENLRAPHDVFDLTLSFDSTDSAINNLYFPIWKYRLNWGFENGESEIQPSPEELINPREISSKSILNICTFSRTTEPSRLRMISAIERNVKIDKYGSGFSNPVDSKLQISSRYSLQLCPENTIRPGYVTEKLQEAWFAKNLPIWEGIHLDQIFNTEAFIDLTNLTSEEISRKIGALTLDEVNWKIQQPLLNYLPDLNDIKFSFATLLEA